MEVSPRLVHAWLAPSCPSPLPTGRVPAAYAATRRSLAFHRATGTMNSLREPAAHPLIRPRFARPPPGPPLWLRAFVVRKAHLGAFRALRAPLLTPQGTKAGRHPRSGQRSTWLPSDEVDAGVPFAPCGRRRLNEVKADEGYWQKVRSVWRAAAMSRNGSRIVLPPFARKRFPG